jgi:hypothetical protein
MAQLSEQAAVGLVRQFVGVHVQGLDFKGRSACYELLLEVLEVSLKGPFAAAAAAGLFDEVTKCTHSDKCWD